LIEDDEDNEPLATGVYYSPPDSDGDKHEDKVKETTSLADLLEKTQIDQDDVGKRAILGIVNKHVYDKDVDPATWEQRLPEIISRINGEGKEEDGPRGGRSDAGLPSAARQPSGSRSQQP